LLRRIAKLEGQMRNPPLALQPRIDRDADRVAALESSGGP